MEKGYNTKQRDEIVEFFNKHRGSFTAKEIIVSGEVSVGEATVYRTLSKLASQGVLKRFSSDGGGSTYQLNEQGKCGSHFHLKCERCQKITHMDCGFIKEIREHIESSHDFTLDIGKTVFYGLCGECEKALEEENHSQNKK